MHFFGGGYADIKEYSANNNWKECFDMMDADRSILAIGAPEIKGGSPIKEFNAPEIVSKLIANCYFIVRPQTEFTQKWFDEMNNMLDKNLSKLKDCWKFTKNDPIICR